MNEKRNEEKISHRISVAFKQALETTLSAASTEHKEVYFHDPRKQRPENRLPYE